MASHTVANEIARQIGNPAFVMMGAKNLVAGEDHLSFKIGRNAQRVSHITVTLEPSDTYRVEFLRCSVKIGRKVVSEVSGVYFDRLHAAIERGTGLYLSL